MILYVVLGGTGGYPSFFCVILKRTGAAACVAIMRAGEKKRLFEYFLEKKDTEYFVN